MASLNMSTLPVDYQGSVQFGLCLVGYFICAVALLVMLGWILEIPSLTTLYHGFPSMKFNTALAFGIGGLGILQGHSAHGVKVLPWAGGSLIFLMLASLLQYPLNINFRIDQLFWSDNYSAELPGRPSPATCVLFIFTGLLMICAQRLSDRCLWMMRTILATGAFISTAALVTYVLDANSLFSVHFFSSIAVHTAILFLIQFAALAVLINKRHSDSVTEILPGWRQMNRLLLPVVVAPLVFGVLLFNMVSAEFMSVALGFGIMTTSFCMTALAGLLWNTTREDRWYQRLVKEIDVRNSMQQRLSTMMDSMPGGVLFLNQDGDIKDANNGVAQMFGYRPSALIGKNITQLLPKESHSRFLSVLNRATKTNKMNHFRQRTFRIQAQHRSYKNFAVLANIWPIDGDAENQGFGVFVFHGEAVERQLEALRREVRFDHLTSVGNKASLDSRLDQLQAYGSRSGEQVAIIMIDIDHFKLVNDSFGHPVGDQILSEFARRVSESLRYSDSLYRYGGEEFTVLVIGASARALYELSERIRACVGSHPFLGIDQPIAVTCSLGVAINDGRELLPDTLKRADKCLYKAKELGRNTTVMA